MSKNITYIGSSAFNFTPWLKQQKDDLVIVNDVLVKYQGKKPNVVVPKNIKVFPKVHLRIAQESSQLFCMME